MLRQPPTVSEKGTVALSEALGGLQAASSMQRKLDGMDKIISHPSVQCHAQSAGSCAFARTQVER